jgi:hypothetical protein
VCGVVITTNHKADGIHLPADDRRHYVAWSSLTKESFEADYFSSLWNWYEQANGKAHVAAYLATLDLGPKAPPPKTAAFWRCTFAIDKKMGLSPLFSGKLSLGFGFLPINIINHLAHRHNRHSHFHVPQPGDIAIRKGSSLGWRIAARWFWCAGIDT